MAKIANFNDKLCVTKKGWILDPPPKGDDSINVVAAFV